jgi:hypothetical protein
MPDRPCNDRINKLRSGKHLKTPDGGRMDELQKNTRCPQFDFFLAEFSPEGPVSDQFSNHARCCVYCRYWLTHLLAVAESCSLLDREKGASCPGRNSFRDLLFVAVRSKKKVEELAGGIGLSQEAKRNVLVASAVEISKLTRLFLHFQECELCRGYYERLYEYEAEAQKRYERELLAGQELIPIILGENSGFRLD